mmetsp:Transcript_58006/g.164821  ORF Transcript_58006/g.164821 Transcript_58006/m.164821 type:complete len:200 (+) Transcript_58006:56-655(+)
MHLWSQPRSLAQVFIRKTERHVHQGMAGASFLSPALKRPLAATVAMAVLVAMAPLVAAPTLGGSLLLAEALRVPQPAPCKLLGTLLGTLIRKLLGIISDPLDFDSWSSALSSQKILDYHVTCGFHFDDLLGRRLAAVTSKERLASCHSPLPAFHLFAPMVREKMHVLESVRPGTNDSYPEGSKSNIVFDIDVHRWVRQQ